MEFPNDFKTLAFCFMAGCLLSVPCGFLMVFRWGLFEPPLWTAPIYLTAVIASFVVLPFWCVFSLPDRPFLSARECDKQLVCPRQPRSRV